MRHAGFGARRTSSRDAACWFGAWCFVSCLPRGASGPRVPSPPAPRSSSDALPSWHAPPTRTPAARWLPAFRLVSARTHTHTHTHTHTCLAIRALHPRHQPCPQANYRHTWLHTRTPHASARSCLSIPPKVSPQLQAALYGTANAGLADTGGAQHACSFHLQGAAPPGAGRVSGPSRGGTRQRWQ